MLLLTFKNYLDFFIVGTGSVIELARKAGFKNTFDVLDASWQMLIQGEKKQLNIRFVRKFVTSKSLEIYVENQSVVENTRRLKNLREKPQLLIMLPIWKKIFSTVIRILN